MPGKLVRSLRPPRDCRMVVAVAAMKIGDRVRLIGTPPNLAEGELKMQSTFQRYLGFEFTVEGFQEECGWLELRVGEATGDPHETIWIEPEYVERCE